MMLVKDAGASSSKTGPDARCVVRGAQLRVVCAWSRPSSASSYAAGYASNLLFCPNRVLINGTPFMEKKKIEIVTANPSRSCFRYVYTRIFSVTNGRKLLEPGSGPLMLVCDCLASPISIEFQDFGKADQYYQVHQRSIILGADLFAWHLQPRSALGEMATSSQDYSRG